MNGIVKVFYELGVIVIVSAKIWDKITMGDTDEVLREFPSDSVTGQERRWIQMIRRKKPCPRSRLKLYKSGVYYVRDGMRLLE